MADGIVLSKETKDLIKVAAKDAVKLPFFIAPVRNVILNKVMAWIDVKGDKVIPDRFDSFINIAINETIRGNYNLAEATASKALAELIKIEGLDDKSEEEALRAVLHALLQVLRSWIERRKKKLAL